MKTETRALGNTIWNRHVFGSLNGLGCDEKMNTPAQPILQIGYEYESLYFN